MEKTIEIAWKRFVEGENAALEPVYGHFYQSMLFKAFYYLKNENAALDVVSDCFERLLSMSLIERKQNLEMVDEKLQGFLMIMVKYRCLDKLKVEKNRLGILKKLSLVNFFPSSILNNDVFENDIIELLLNLPDKQREVLELHLAGFDLDEIASRTETSYNTVRNQLSSARQKMREILKVLTN